MSTSTHSSANPEKQYKPVFARDILSRHDLMDTDVYYKNGTQYSKVEYLGWHRNGTTWIGGTLDVGFGVGIDEIQINPDSYLYVLDQEQPVTPVLPKCDTPTYTELSAKSLPVDERLAMYIVGYLALHNSLDYADLHYDKRLLWIIEDISVAIREALPELDMIELNQVAQRMANRQNNGKGN